MSDVIKLSSGSVPRTKSGRSRLGGAIPLHFASTGSFVPRRVVTNDDLAHLGCDSQWIIQRTGIRERRFASSSEASSDLAYAAAQHCLESAGVGAEEVDLLLVSTITPDYPTPSTACVLQQKLGCCAPAMDINAACSGFVYGLITAAQFIHSGAAKNALVVGAEIMSRTISPEDVKTYPLFGDGAGAMLLQPAEAAEDLTGQGQYDEPMTHNAIQGSLPGILAYTMGSEGNIQALCTPGGGSREPLTAEGLVQGRQYMRMEGRSVFKWAVRCIVDSCNDVVAAAGYSMEDVDLLVLHQANIRIMDAAVESFSIPRERVVVNLDRYGNTSAASVPLALDEAHREGKITRGSLVLLCGFGSGLTWGTALLRW
jgi:3-oxoacyl-[acyl-carrier-protein] synthase III